MNIDNLPGEAWQYFARHFISGMVVCLFVLFLPLSIMKGLTNGFTDRPLLIILLALIVGLFLNSFKTYRVAWRLLHIRAANDRTALRTQIIRNFEITMNDSEYKKNKEYEDKVQTICVWILDLFVALYQPELFRRLQHYRIEMDVVAISLFSIMIFSIFGLILGFVHIVSFETNMSWQWMLCSETETIPMIIWFGVSLVIPFLVRREADRLNQKVDRLNNITGLIVASAMDRQKQADEKTIHDFYKRLKNDFLIEENNGAYFVKP